MTDMKKVLTTILLLVTTAQAQTNGLKLNPTIYYIQTVDVDKDCSAKKNILDEKGNVLFKVCKDHYKTCVIEGTCAVVEDGAIATSDENVTLINYLKQDKSGKYLFKEINTDRCPFGLGVSNICLDPYYSVAADLDYNKPGDVIFVPKLKGISLPNGDTHSGFLIVRDKGGAIKGANRFDFYTGFMNYKDDKNPFTHLGFADSDNNIEYRKATAQEAQQFKKMRNYPLIPGSENTKD